jgi:hypothetical protein
MGTSGVVWVVVDPRELYVIAPEPAVLVAVVRPPRTMLVAVTPEPAVIVMAVVGLEPAGER